MNQPDPSHIMQVGMGFWASKVLLSAVRLKLFTFLGQGGKRTNDIKEHLQLQTSTRHVCDWLDALVSLGFLQRDGLMENATYSNTPATAMFLDRTRPTYMGGILEMANNRLYRFWGDLDEALLTGRPQNESKHGNMHFFEELYRSPEKLHEFMDAMSGFQAGNFMALVKSFDFSRYKTIADIGGADAFLSCTIRAAPSGRHVHDLRPSGREAACGRANQTVEPAGSRLGRQHRHRYSGVVSFGRRDRHGQHPARVRRNEEGADPSQGPRGGQRRRPVHRRSRTSSITSDGRTRSGCS
jgi:hypothetical protein